MTEPTPHSRQDMFDERRAATPAFGGNSAITVRDFFAAAAVTGLAPAYGKPINAEDLADQAYRVADEMLKRRPA